MAICGSVDRVLAEVSSGVVGAQVEKEGIRITVIVSPTLDNLSGKALQALRPFAVFVNDYPWNDILGHVFTVPGGTELLIDSVAFDALGIKYGAETIPDSELILATLNDVTLPPARVMIVQHSIARYCQITEPETGPRTLKHPEMCEHRKVDLSCPSCLSLWWRSRASIMGEK